MNAKQFPTHHMHVDTSLLYLGTHYGYDIFINLSQGPDRGYMYAVYGAEPHEYASAIGYGFTRTNEKAFDSKCYLAAACALLCNPCWIPIVMAAHQ